MKKIFSILTVSFALITIISKATLLNYPQQRQPGFIKNDLTVQPNAVTKDVKILFKSAVATNAVVTVTDENGKKVLQLTAKITAGNNNINIDNFHSLHEGNYTIQLTSNNEIHSTRFLIWK
jgi:Secretion system C-terminal sorting domain